MATITKDYVSFETAKLLKEKGFPQDPNICNTAYTTKGKLSNNAKSFAFYYELIKPRVYYTAPTLQMAMKWLREVHKLAIIISPRWAEGDMRNPCKWSWEIKGLKNTNKDIYGNLSRDTYEESCDVAIKYCLEKLI